MLFRGCCSVDSSSSLLTRFVRWLVAVAVGVCLCACVRVCVFDRMHAHARTFMLHARPCCRTQRARVPAQRTRAEDTCPLR